MDFAAWPRAATFRLKLSPESTRNPPLHTRGISRARSFDLEVTRWAPARLTSCISHPGSEESSGASTLPPGPAQPPSASNLPPNRPTSLCCTPTAFLDRSSCWPLPACKMQQVAGALIPHLPEKFSPFGGPSHGE